MCYPTPINIYKIICHQFDYLVNIANIGTNNAVDLYNVYKGYSNL